MAKKVRERLIDMSRLDEIGDSFTVEGLKAVTGVFWITCYNNIPPGAFKEISDVRRQYKFAVTQLYDGIEIKRVE